MFFASTRWLGEMHLARSLFIEPLDKEPSAYVFYESHVAWLQLSDDLHKKNSQAHWLRRSVDLKFRNEKNHRGMRARCTLTPTPCT